MSDETKRVLEMVAAGKITVDEGERLLGALGAGRSAPLPSEADRPVPRFLKMEAGATDKDGKEEGFRLRVPLDLLRAGIKMRALIPETKRDKVNEKLREKGIEGDVFEMSDDEIDTLIRSLGELEMEAGDGDGGFRLYLE
ncbi:MAG: SHOCT-like domain-containing protein [Alphaproteobacteria bacterium]